MKRIIIVLTVFLFLCTNNKLCSQSQNNLENQSLILRGVTIVDGNGTDPIRNQTIIIENGYIKEILNTNRKKDYLNTNILDVSNHWVIPGLIEGHNHISGITDEELQKALRYGVMGIRDMAGDAQFLKNTQTRINKNELLAPDIYYSALFAGESLIQNDFRTRLATPDSIPLGDAPWMRQIDENTNISEVIKEAKNCGATGIKLYAYLTPELVNKIVTEAHIQGLKVWAHAFVYPAKPEDLVDANCDGLSHAPFLLYPLDWEYQPNGSFDLSAEVLSSKRIDNILNDMKRKNIILDPTLFLFKVTISELIEKKPELNNKLELAYDITRKVYHKGIKIAVGTDFSLINEKTNKPSIFDEIYLLVNEIGMSPIEVISACTKNNAELIGIEKTLGTIEVGKRANLIVLKNDPTVDITNIEDPVIVIKNGKIVLNKLE